MDGVLPVLVVPATACVRCSTIIACLVARPRPSQQPSTAARLYTLFASRMADGQLAKQRVKPASGLAALRSQEEDARVSELCSC